MTAFGLTFWNDQMKQINLYNRRKTDLKTEVRNSLRRYILCLRDRLTSCYEEVALKSTNNHIVMKNDKSNVPNSDEDKSNDVSQSFNGRNNF